MKVIVFGAAGGVGKSVVQRSLDAGLNYTIVRPMSLTDKEFIGKYR